MVGVDKFEDLIAWQKARVLVKSIYAISSQSRFVDDYALVNQIRRASISIMSNIAEGFERGSPADFHRFLVIAKASCAEVRSQLYIALYVRYITDQDFHTLMAQALEASRVIGGLRASVERRKLLSTHCSVLSISCHSNKSELISNTYL
jgi:four helix bundle protein